MPSYSEMISNKSGLRCSDKRSESAGPLETEGVGYPCVDYDGLRGASSYRNTSPGYYHTGARLTANSEDRDVGRVSSHDMPSQQCIHQPSFHAAV